MSLRKLNNTLMASLMDEEPFVYAHLIKFEKALSTISKQGSRKASTYSYITDGSRDIVFDDGTKALDGTSNGAQTYVANKVRRVGNITEKSIPSAHSIKIEIDAVALFTQNSLSVNISQDIDGTYAGKTGTMSASVDWVELGYSEGDILKVIWEHSSVQYERKIRIERFTTSNSVIVWSAAIEYGPEAYPHGWGHTAYFIQAGSVQIATPLTANIVYCSDEGTGPLIKKTSTGYANYINRDVFIYKAHIDPDTHAFIGEPYLIYKGIVQAAKLTEDPKGKRLIAWSIASHWSDFNRVTGRLTSDEHHRQVSYDTEAREVLKRPEYASDLGFQHSSQAVNLIATYQVKETKYKIKNKKGLFKSKAKLIETEVDVDTEADIRFNLTPKYLPVIYGVNKVKGIPFFVDTHYQKTAQVFVTYALCEGEVSSLYDIHFEGTSSLCSDSQDFNTRNPVHGSLGFSDPKNAANEDIDIICLGRVDKGEVLQGQTTTDSTKFQKLYQVKNAMAVRRYRSKRFREDIAPVFLYGPYPQVGTVAFWDADLTNYMFLTATAGTDMLGITTGKGVSFATPTDVRMVFHDGSPNQKADPFLTYMAGNQYFKIQGDYFTGDKANYWGPNHRVLDTAYVTAKWTINEGESDIPETSYTVKGQLIPCYNYDYSFTTAGVVQNGFIPSTSANLAGGPVATKDTLESLSELFKIGAEVDAYGFGVVPGAAPVTTFGHADNNALGTSLGKVTIEEIFLTQTKDAVIVPRIRISKSPAIAATQDTVSTFATSYVRHGPLTTDIEIEGTEDDLNLFLVGQTIKAPNLSNDGKGSFFPNLGASDALPTIIQFVFGEYPRSVLDINGNVIGEETYNAIRIRLSTATSTEISYRGLRLEIAVGAENFENNPKHRLFYLKSGTKKLYLERHDYSVASGTVAAEVSVPLNSTPATAITAGTQPTDSDSPVETNAQGIKITLDSTSSAAQEVMKNLASSKSFSLVRSGRNRRTNSTSKHQMETLFGYYTDSLSYTDGASSGTIDNIGVSNPTAAIGTTNTILDEAREEINLLISRDQINLTTSNMLPKTAAYNNYFNGYLLKLTATAADGSVYVQDRTITAYDGLTAIATVDEPWHSGYVPLTNTTYHTNTLDTFTFEIFPQPDYRTSINPAIQTLDYLTSERYGLGLNKDIDIDLEKFKKAARDCDERSNISVFVEKESANTPVIGETYVYPNTTAPTWMGTVNNFHERTYSVHNLNSGNPVDYYQIIFSNCKGKLVHRATDWKELQTDMLVYFQEPGPTGTTSLYKTPTLESTFATGGFSTGGTPNHGLFYSIIGHNTYTADNNVKNGDTMPGKAEIGDGVPIPFRTNTTIFPNLRTAVGGGQSFGDDDDSLPPSSAITSIDIYKKGNWYIQAWIGYFRPPYEGKWDFRIQSDDTASVYIGDLALAPDRTTRTTANAVTVQTEAAKGWGTSRDGTTNATNSFYTHVPEGRTQDGTLYTDVYYPIKIVWHAGGGKNYFRFFYKRSVWSTWHTNFGENFFYWKNGHNYSRRTSTSGAAPLTTSNAMDTDTNIAVADTAELALVGANLYGFNATSKSLKLEHASSTFDGNKIIKGWSGTYPGGSGYSLYDADDVKYWRMCGWDEHAQTSATRHQLNPKIETSKPFFANLNNLLSQFNGVLRFNNSKYELVIEKEADNVLDSIENSTTLERYTPGSLTADDIIGAINIEDQGIKKAFNTIACTYTAPDNLFENREVTFLNSDYLKEDKYVPKKGSAKVEFITNYHNARMQAKQMLEASRYSTTITFTIGPKGVLLLPGEIIEITYPNFDWANKQFRIETLVQKADCLVQVTATEHNDYTYNSVNSLTASASQGSEGGGGASSDITKTSFPTALTATTNTKGGITLNWTNSSVFAPQTHTVEIYRSIYNRREATQLPWNGTTVENIAAPTLIGTTTGTSFTDSLATANAAVGEFYYWIRYQILVQAKSAATAPKLAVSRYEPAGNGVEGKGGPAIDGVVINLSNSSSTVPTNTSDALVFDNTGTTITVKEGNTALDYKETLQLFPHLLSPREAVTNSNQFLLPGFFEGLSIVTGMTLTVHSSDSSTSISGGSATIDALDKEYAYRAWNNRVTLNKNVTLTTDSILQISGPGSKRSSFKVTGRTLSSGVTAGTGSGAGTTFTAPAITGLTGDTGHRDFTVVVTNSSGQEATFTPRQTFSKALRGATGINSRTVTLNSDTLAFVYDENGANPSPSSTTLTASSLNTAGTAKYQFIKTHPTTTTLRGIDAQATFNYNAPASFSDTPETIEVKLFEGTDETTIYASDSISIGAIKKSSSALSAIMSNESHAVPASFAGVVSSMVGSGTTIAVFEGATALQFITSGTVAAGQFEVSAAATSITTVGTIAVSVKSAAIGDHSGFSSSDDTAKIVYTLTGKRADGTDFSFTREQSFSKSSDAQPIITAELSNPIAQLPTLISSGTTYAAPDMTTSDTDIHVKEGETELTFITSGTTAPGEYKIVTTTNPSTGLTVGGLSRVQSGSIHFARTTDHSAMNVDSIDVIYTITGRRANGEGFVRAPAQSLTKNKIGATGASGINAKTVVLTANKYVISYDEAGTESSTITCTATPKNISSADYKFELDGDTKQEKSSTATYDIAQGDEPTAGTSKLVKVTAFDNDIEVATDTISVFGVKDGENSLTVVATNEAHVFPANAGGEIAAGDFADGGIDFRVFRGSTQLNVGSGNNEFDVVATTATGITAGAESTVSTSTKRFAAPSGMAASTDKASILFTITAKNPAGATTTITKLQTFTKSKKGESTIVLTISNENITIPQATRTVQATPYTASGTILQAFDGADALQFAVKSTYDALSSANKKGVFTLTSATGTNITPGAITDIGTGASIANAQSMTATTASILFTIEGFRTVANGGAALPALEKTQNFSEATQGTPAVDSKVRLSIFKSFSSILSLPTDDDGFPEGDNFYTISTGAISGDDIPNYTATRPTLTTAKPYLYRRDGIVTITAGQTGQIDLTAANTFGNMILDNTLQVTKKELIIYQNTNSSTAPGNPNGSLTYTIATDVVSGSNLGSWSDSAPAPDITKPYLWTARQVIEYDNSSTTVSVIVQHWVVSLLLVRSIRGTATYTFDVSDTIFMNSQGTGAYSQPNSSFISGRATTGNAGANAFTVAWAGTLSNTVGRAIVGLVQNNSPDGAIHEGDVVKIIDTTDSANPEIATRIFRINPSMSSTAQPRAYGSPFGPGSNYTSTTPPNWQSISTTTGSSNYWSAKVVEKFDGSVIVEGTLAANAITSNSVLTKNIGLGTGGSITLSGESGKIVQGKTNFNTAAAGFFLGLHKPGAAAAVPKFIIGDADMVGSTGGKGIYWDGTVLGVRGDISGGGITSSAGAGTGAGFFLDNDGTAFIGKEGNSFKVTTDGIELNAPISSDSVIGGGITVTQFGTFGTGAYLSLYTPNVIGTTDAASMDVGTIPATAVATRPKATITASATGGTAYARLRLFLVMNDAGANTQILTATISNVASFNIYNTTFHIATFSAGYSNFNAGDILTQGSNSITAGTKYTSGGIDKAILYGINGAVPVGGTVNVEVGESGDTVVATADLSFDQGNSTYSRDSVTLTGYLPQATSSAVTVKLQARKYNVGAGSYYQAWNSSDSIYNVFGFGENV